MRLLIITQAVDANDPILGFFPRWITGFAARCERVTVIAQRVGTHNLPANVAVHSLGKERGSNLSMQVLRFWYLQLALAGQYDAVFVHMTPVWAVIGSPLWLPLRKRIYLWYEARGGGWPLALALRVVRKAFSASAGGMPRRTPKSVITGHGIDTAAFAPPSAEREEHLVVTVSRVTAAKRLDFLLRAFLTLPAPARFVIAGIPITPADRAYGAALRERIRAAGAADRVTIQELPHTDVAVLLARATLFIHASHTGLDKAVLEAMACGCPVLSSGSAFRTVLLPECTVDDDDFAPRMRAMLALPARERERLGGQLRGIVESRHSLQNLVERLVEEME